MGKIIVKEDTCKNPITMIGEYAGECYGANTSDEMKNYKRGLDCLQSQHGRPLEFPQIYLKLEGYSARAIRELYTHIGGAPARLQASTRYINYGEFDYIIPQSFIDAHMENEYCELMQHISNSFKEFQTVGIPKEDIANILPLGMTSTIVIRTNLRNLLDMGHQRLCGRAYWEMQNMMEDIKEALGNYSVEWAIILKDYFVPKCVYLGKCPESKPCGNRS